MEGKRKLIGLCGFAKSGKDTAALVLLDKGWKRIAFADALKADVHSMVTRAALTAGAKVPDFTDPEVKERIRPLYVAYGAYMRTIKPTYWIDRLFADMSLLDEGPVVVTDVRYLNEVNRVQKEGGVIIQISRPGCVPANSEEERSFAEIASFSSNIIPVSNNAGIEDLLEQIYAIASSL
jgi:hypothetical protein